MVQHLLYLAQQRLTICHEEIDSLSGQETIAYIARRLEEARILPEGKGTEHLDRLIRILINDRCMNSAYFPESSIPLPITLIRASEHMPDMTLPVETSEDLGWNRYSDQQVDIHYVPGNHLTMMSSPNVEELARILTQSIG
jgi:thioesterase domain-containing protein